MTDSAQSPAGGQVPFATRSQGSPGPDAERPGEDGAVGAAPVVDARDARGVQINPGGGNVQTVNHFYHSGSDSIWQRSRGPLVAFAGGADRLAVRVRWVSLPVALAALVAVVVLLGSSPPTAGGTVVYGAGWQEYFHSDSDPRVDGFFADNGVRVVVAGLSGQDQVRDAADPNSRSTFYLAPNDAIRDEIRAALEPAGGSIYARVYDTQMVVATYEPVRAALAADRRLAERGADGYVRLNLDAYLRTVHAAAVQDGSALRWGDVPGFPAVWRKDYVRIAAPSPCYAGGGWAYIGMLAHGLQEVQGPDQLPSDLQWLYGSRRDGPAEQRSRDVTLQWVSASRGPLYSLYEQDALAQLIQGGVTLAGGPGALIYPDPPVAATHWVIARKTDLGQKMVDLLSDQAPWGGEARRLRQVQAERFGVRFTDPALRGSFRDYVNDPSRPWMAKVVSGGPITDPAAPIPLDHRVIRSYVAGLRCFVTASGGASGAGP